MSEGEAAHAALPARRSRRRAAVVSLLGGYATLLLLVVQGLVLVPLYLRHLGPATWGAWAASGDVLSWLAVLDMGIAGISMQRMAAAHGRGDHRLVADYYGTAVVLQGALVALLTLIALAASPFVPGWVGLQGEAARELSACFVVAAVATGLGLAGYVVGGLASATQRMVFVNLATFAAGVAQIAVTLALLLDGRGLWALALGMLARTGLLLVLLGGHAVWVLRTDLRARARVRWRVARDFTGLSGVVVLTMIGNTVAGRSDAVLVALFYGPTTVAVYVLTRRAAELLAMFLARIGAAVYPGFAHLLGSGQRERAGVVAGQVARLYFWSAVPAVALYMALNRTFVALWVGPAQFGGQWLTVAVGLNVLVTGWAALLLYIFGAAGEIARSGKAIFAEAMARAALALALLWAMGVEGLPVAGIATTLVAGYLALGWLYRAVGVARPRIPWRDALPGAALLALGIAAGTARWGDSWPELVAWGALFGAGAAGAVLACEPRARGVARGLGARLRGARDGP